MYAIIYSFFKARNDFNPHLGSVCLLFLIIFSHVGSIFFIINSASGFRLVTPGSVNKFYLLPLIALLLFYIYRYYTKHKDKILNVFQKKTPTEKAVWGIITVLSFIIPLIIVFTFFPKKG
jgi:hypothetical protein